MSGLLGGAVDSGPEAAAVAPGAAEKRRKAEVKWWPRAGEPPADEFALDCWAAAVTTGLLESEVAAGREEVELWACGFRPEPEDCSAVCAMGTRESVGAAAPACEASLLWPCP
jgi:hypothetical protein